MKPMATSITALPLKTMASRMPPSGFSVQTGSHRRRNVLPIILNVKGFDLFHIDRRSNRYHPDEHLASWQAMGFDDPQPFQNVTFYAPQMPGGDIAASTGRTGPVQAYSWCLRDIIEQNLFS